MNGLKRNYAVVIAFAALLFLPGTHDASCLHLTKASREAFPKHIIEITKQFSLLETIWPKKTPDQKKEVISKCEAIQLITSNVLALKPDGLFNKKLGTFERQCFTPDVVLFSLLLTPIYNDTQKIIKHLGTGPCDDKKFNKLKGSINLLKNVLKKETTGKIDIFKDAEFKNLYQTTSSFQAALKFLNESVKATMKETNPDIRKAFSRSWNLIVIVWANSIEADAKKCLKLQKKTPDAYQRALALRIKYCAQKLQKREEITHTLSDLGEAKNMIDTFNLFRTKS
ncbi:MAG: hypothetical protein UV38_C0001G0007 [candidate division TM6 bacterium GW2011_GWE2_42_60]|nr:MAG: hypothetical protein UV38_C0001G0007 [candidate division TM6 bacterium GW2011_GWE2_42_60]HBY05797.1 hypothetical protein [Candidatus Dependentiae bacterium]